MSSGRSDRTPRKVKKTLKKEGKVLLIFHMDEGLYERVLTFAQISTMSPDDFLILCLKNGLERYHQ